MPEDESHSGDSQLDLFTEEQLLPPHAPAFRPVIRAWSVPAKPKPPAVDEGDAQNKPEPKMGGSDSSLPVKMKSTTGNSTELRALLPPPTTENFEDVRPTAQPTPQNLTRTQEGKEEKRTAPQALNILAKPSNHISTKESPSAVPHTTTTMEQTTAATVASQSTVVMEISEQNRNTGAPIYREPEHLTRTVPSPTTRRNSVYMPETLGSTAGTAAMFEKVPSGVTASPTNAETAAAAIRTTPHGTEAKAYSSTAAPVNPRWATSAAPPTATTASKPAKRKYSISWDEEEEMEEEKEVQPKIIKAIVEEILPEKPQRRPGKRKQSSHGSLKCF